MLRLPRHLLAAALLSLVGAPSAAQVTPGDFTLREYRFESGEVLRDVRLHYVTLGTPRRDAAGVVTNAVLILHGTGGTGGQFLGAGFAGGLYGAGQPLDTARYYVILPDNIGHGASSKPSDGLRTKFPRYGYTDMVKLQHLLLDRGLGVRRVHVVMGTSMGCMHAWATGTSTSDASSCWSRPHATPDAPDDPPAMTIKLTRTRGIHAPPAEGLRSALGMLFMMTSAPLVQQRQAPTRDAADSAITAFLDARVRTTDANDMLYQFDSSRDYDPSPHLERITVPVLTINSADDLVNPPELGLMERLMPRVKRGSYLLVPIGDRTRGHGTHTIPAIWGDTLRGFLSTLPTPGGRGR
jgi:homoserine O-acetyltransferase